MTVPYVRKLPSGRWQATVYLPDRTRRTYTAPLKGEATAWGLAQQARIRRGEWSDPRTARTVFKVWRDKWLAARVVEADTMRGDRATLRLHIDPTFATMLVPAITRLDVQGWVRGLQQAGVGAHAIRRAYNLLSSILGAAVLEGIITTSPCRKIDLPATPTKAPAWFTPEQVRAILDELPQRHAAGAALMCWTGLRWGEMAGLRVGDVDYARGVVSVVVTRTQAGALKAYPKSSASRRQVPCPAPVLAMLSQLAGERDGGDTLFTTERQDRPWSASNWRRVWDEALARAGAPPYSPHTCRHTAASWLVQAGVDLYRVQQLLGHENAATTQRYAHLAPGAHVEVHAAWGRIGRPAIEAS